MNHVPPQALRRRMSLERLALLHVAVSGQGPATMVDIAQTEATVGELTDILIGPSFADTLALSRPFLDLYEYEAHVGPRRPGRAAGPFALVEAR
jgi:hypothetical protein